jgi:16S rRNA (uracil1498-N3)-methyltransferase
VTVRIYVEPDHLGPGPLAIEGDEHRYLSRVRRVAAGEGVELFDGRGRVASAVVARVGKSRSELEVAAPFELPPSPFALTVAPALIKGERMDTAISKLVELGVTTLRPFASEHSVVRLSPERAASRQARFEALAVAAGRQSRNLRLPEIAPVAELDPVLGACAGAQLRLVPTTLGDTQPLASCLPDGPLSSAAVLIGPEGGFSEAEVARAVASGFVPVHLGPRVLRAETAALAVASVLLFRYGDTGSR